MFKNQQNIFFERTLCSVNKRRLSTLKIIKTKKHIKIKGDDTVFRHTILNKKCIVIPGQGD